MDRRSKDLTFDQRKLIESMLKDGYQINYIERTLGLGETRIFRELKRCNATRDTYDAQKAQMIAEARRKHMNTDLITVSNPEPTESEKQMYQHYGLYLVKKTDYSLKYAPVYLDHYDTYPESITTSAAFFDQSKAVTFDLMSENVLLNSFFDVEAIELIGSRMKELQFT